MSDPGEQGKKAGRKFLPYTYIVGRLLVVVPTLLIIFLVCAGFAGWGPGHRLHGAAAVPAVNWVTNKQPDHRRHRKHHPHHKKHHHHHKHHHQGKKRKDGRSG